VRGFSDVKNRLNVLLDGGIVNKKNEISQGELFMETHPFKARNITQPEWYRHIFSPLPEPTREFIVNGCTYGEVYRLASGIRRLQPSDKEDRAMICICTGDKALIAAALFASLAGGPRVVLPYAFSRQAVEEVLETLPCTFLCADRSGDFPSGCEVITPSTLHCESINSCTYMNPDVPFLMLFTGGSTGKPKVWSKTPRNMFAEARYQADTFRISPTDIFLSTVPAQHIYGLLFSVLIPFVSSARVLDGVYTFPGEILRTAEEHRASILVSVPIHYRILKSDDLQKHNFRMAFSSAGVLDKGDAAYFHEKTGLDIIEIYGSTETGGVATRRRSRDGESWRPLDTVAWKIRDERLHVKSDFISPTLPRDAEGFFATADCAEAESNRSFILRGRADDIVKIGGKRVDLASVQAKIKQISGVRDAVVISLPAGKGRQNELAALVATHLDSLHLRKHIAAVSESYAVPKRIIVIDEIPVTPAGKYDRTGIERILTRRK
jgi:acyl-coenzyme A synthetase/AMP-(fatty) acid ligase